MSTDLSSGSTTPATLSRVLPNSGNTRLVNSFHASYQMGFWPVLFLEHNICYSIMTTSTKKMQLFHEISVAKWLSFPMIYSTIYFRFSYCVKLDNQFFSVSKKLPIHQCMAQLGPFLLPIYRCVAQKEFNSHNTIYLWLIVYPLF